MLHTLPIAVRKIIHAYIRNLKESKSTYSARISLKTGSKFGYYLRFSLFCFLKGRALNFIRASYKDCKQNVLKAVSRGVLQKSDLKNFAKFTENSPESESLLNEIGGFSPAT